MSTQAPSLEELMTGLRASAAFAHKRDIAPVLDLLRDKAVATSGAANLAAIENGDDCAALNDGQGGYLLFAMEGMIDSFVEALPWFAGYSAVMVNVSDVYAMGGRPIAVIDAIWSQDAEQAAPVLTGMREASKRYGVPLVGGHTNHRASKAGLAAAILGRANSLLAAAEARVDDLLIMAVDLRGAYVDPHPFWNASTEAPAERLRADLEILPQLAEAGLCRSAKDISMAGPLGTTLMLLEAAGLGADIDLAALPIPEDVPMKRWLVSFPSYGFVLSVHPAKASQVLKTFADRGLAAAVVGQVTDNRVVNVKRGEESVALWDFGRDPFIGARPNTAINDQESEALVCQ